MNSPFAQVYASYAENGLSVIPIHPKGKNPAFIDPRTNAWMGLMDWSRFCNEKPSQELLDAWAEMPDANIGACMGQASNMIAVDIDTNDAALIKKFKKELPATPFVKIGRRGCNLLYRFNPKIPTRSFALDGERTKVIEFLSTGKQIVLPHSIHPDSGIPYRWENPEFSLEFHSTDALPELTEEAFIACAEIVGQKVKDIEDMFERRKLPKVQKILHADDVWNQLNDRALANLHVWIPVLFPDYHLKNKENYRINATWRGGENYNLSIHPEGIKDFASDEKYNPITLVKTAFGLSAAEAYTALSNVVIPPEERAQSQKLAEGFIAAAAKTHASVALSTPIIITQVKSRFGTPPEPPEGIFETAPNALGVLASFIRSNSGTPLPELCLAAALPTLSNVLGNRIATDTDLRGNIYTIGLAASATGKNDTLKIPMQILTALNNKDNIIGSPASASALIHSMNKGKGNSIWFQDEMGKFLRFITSPSAGNHEATVLTALMELYTSSESEVYYGRSYAPTAGKAAYTLQVENPYLNFYSASTPDPVFDSLTSKEAVDGFAGRFLLFNSNAEAAKPMFRRTVNNGGTRPLSEIVDYLMEVRSVVTDKYYNANGNNRFAATLINQPYVVPYTVEALDYLENVIAPLLIQRGVELQGTSAAYLQAVWNRAAAHIGKVALLASDFNQIGLTTVKWAADLVVYLMEYLCFKLYTSVHDTPERAAAKDIHRAIVELNAKFKRYVTRGELLRHRLLKRYNKKMVTDALDLLLAMEVIDFREEKSGKKPTQTFVALTDFES